MVHGALQRARAVARGQVRVGLLGGRAAAPRAQPQRARPRPRRAGRGRARLIPGGAWLVQAAARAGIALERGGRRRGRASGGAGPHSLVPWGLGGAGRGGAGRGAGGSRKVCSGEEALHQVAQEPSRRVQGARVRLVRGRIARVLRRLLRDLQELPGR